MISFHEGLPEATAVLALLVPEALGLVVPAAAAFLVVVFLVPGAFFLVSLVFPGEAGAAVSATGVDSLISAAGVGASAAIVMVEKR